MGEESKDRTGEWIFELWKDGAFYARRSMTCGKKTAKDAEAQWKRKGYKVFIIQRPSL